MRQNLSKDFSVSHQMWSLGTACATPTHCLEVRFHNQVTFLGLRDGETPLAMSLLDDFP